MFGHYGVIFPSCRKILLPSGRLPDFTFANGEYQCVVYVELAPDSACRLVHHRVLDCDHAELLVIGVLYQDISQFTSLRHFEKSCDGAFSAIAVTPDSMRIYRDPVGYRSNYFYLHPSGAIYFSSNIRWLKEKLGLSLAPQPQHVVDFLCTSFIPGSATLTAGVSELSMGHYLHIDANRPISAVDYCVYASIDKCDDISQSDASHQLWNLCLQNMQSIRSATGYDDPHLFLSGGLDSTTTLALACEVFETQKIHALSVNFGAHLPNENTYIDEAVRYFGIPHHYLEVQPSTFSDAMHEIYQWIDDPIGDPVVMPNYLMNRYLGFKSALILTGEGSDPCFGGPKNVFMLGTQVYSPMYADSQHRDFLARAYLDSFKRASDELDDLPRLSSEAVIQALERLAQTINRYLLDLQWSSMLDRLLFANKFLKCNSLILPKVQKTTQAFNHLSLSPLYSRRIIEFCAQTPVHIKYKNLQEKFILKTATHGKIPSSITRRRKSGMRVPLRFWNDNNVTSFHKNILLKKYKHATHYFFERKRVEAILSSPVPRQGLKAWMLSSFVLTSAQLYDI